MLRVIKPTSLSIGSWILSSFAALASTAAASEVTGIAPRLGQFVGWGAALFGPPLASYTGVLLSNTAVPAWHEARGQLPVLFVSSGAAAGAGTQLLVTGLTGAGRRERGPMVRLAVAGAAAELAIGEATRFAVFEAGIASASDPQHVVAPQRARLTERGSHSSHSSAEGSWLATENATSPVPRT